jgi:putative glycosyltransferase (TIGR04372 family)
LLLYSNVTNCSARAYEVQARWGAGRPLLSLSSKDVDRGRAALAAMGIPDNAWYVCVHARGAGYSRVDEHFHSHRNVEIDSYVAAMQEIVARGGRCIRMGDPTMEPLPDLPGVVDYARSPLRADWLDIFLCASCTLFLGCSSGLYVVASIFGRPTALANQTPLDCAYSPFPTDLAIPRMMLNADGSVMRMVDAFASGIASLRLTEQFQALGIGQMHNSSEEITQLAIEALDRQQGTVLDAPDDEQLQQRFRGYFKNGAYCWPPSSRISRDFLRRHRQDI